MTNRRLLGALVLAALTAAACGTRLPDSAFVATGETADGGGFEGPGFVDGGFVDGGGFVDPSAPAGGDDQGASSDGGGTGTGRGNGTGRAGGAGGGGTGGGGTTATTAPSGDPGKPNYASDTGVTANAIKVGNIRAESGPLGDKTFTPPYHGARAYFLDLNARGGLRGRQIQFVSCDDVENPEKNKACARRLIEDEQVFAMVANATDAGVSGKIISDAGVPLVGGQPIGNEYYQFPTLYSMLGSEGYVRDGSMVAEDGRVYVQAGYFKWYKEQGATRAGLIFYSTPAIAKQAADFIRRGLESVGIKVVYEPANGQGKNPADLSFDSEVIGMLNADADIVFQAIDIAGFQRLCASIEKFDGGSQPQMKWVSGTVNSMGQLVGAMAPSCRNRVHANTESWPYSDTSNAEIARFQAAMARYAPNEPLHQWALEGWVAAKLFHEGVERMGADVTRKGLIEWLDAQRAWKGGGLMAKVDWRRDKIDRTQPVEECFAISQWQDSVGTFVPRATPFTCRTNVWSYYDAAS